MNQIAIDFKSPPHVRGSATSKAAAERIAPKAGTKRAKVLECLKKVGTLGLTDEQMQYWLKMPANTQRPRRVELVKAGLIKDSGRTRPTLGGDQAVVWVVA